MKKSLKSISVLLVIFPFLTFAQNIPIINATLKGKIIDNLTLEPLVGVSVSIKGTTNGALTDINGEFNLITGQKLPFTLLVSYVGYKKTEVLAANPLVEIRLSENENSLGEIIVTSRRKSESVQNIPIPITAISGSKSDDAGAFNVNRLKELIPSVQLYSSNARNTSLNIRGLGSTFGLTNDGLDPGVGFYIDGVYYARPAATALDFVDIEQVEVLRGPQGTLYGKNTTAGAFNITTRQASFSPGAVFEVSYGNYGYIQAKSSITGAISKKIAARISFSGTQRDGTIYNLHTQSFLNDINNIGFRGQLLYAANDNLKITFAADLSNQKPNGYGWPVAGIVKTQRPAYRQFDNIISDLGYKMPYSNAFQRIVDQDTPSKSENKFGGLSATFDQKIGLGTLTSILAYRNWKWNPSNDRDYIGLPVFSISAGNSKHWQISEEIRYAGKFTEHLNGLVGVFGLWQNLNSDPVQTEEVGAAEWRFAQSTTSSLWRTTGLFDNFGIHTYNSIKSASLALFSQIDWAISQKFKVLPGLRYNFDRKSADYNRVVYGGLQTTDPSLLALKNLIYTNQSFNTTASEINLSGNITVQYLKNSKLNIYGTYSTGYKPVGINIGGLPTLNGQVLINLAKIKPENVQHLELGIKTKPTSNSNLNFSLFTTNITNYQTQVQTPEPGVNRGYLANAEKVQVKGLEVDGNLRLTDKIHFNAGFSYTDGKYLKFANAPVPLEEVGGVQAYKDISGTVLPGVSKYAGNIGGEFNTKGIVLGLKGNYFVGIDVYARSKFSSSPSPSKYLNIDGYTLTNVRVGFRASNGISILFWSRNMFNIIYFEQLLAAPGSAGQYAGIIGDPRTYGITLRYVY